MQATFLRRVVKKPTQEMIVALVTLVFILFFGGFIKNFATYQNFLTLISNVSVLGILAIGMALVVIGRGIDLSQVAVMAISAAWVLHLLQDGMRMDIAILLVLAAVLFMGALNGFLIAFVEIPALFATLASGIFFFGFIRILVLKGEGYFYVPAGYSSFLWIGNAKIAGIAVSIILFALIAIIAQFLLFKISHGRFIYAHGDTSDAARMSGIAVRPLTILEYTLCAGIGFLAGILKASMVAQIDLRIINSTLIFDVILVVVLGGVSLIGGRGSIWSVLAGTALIGTLLNGMTMMDIPSNVQDIVKSIALLGALILDNRLHPRDEETARQGDI